MSKSTISTFELFQMFPDRSGSHGKIQLASVTAIIAALSDGNPLAFLTGRTRYAVRPQTRFQIESRGFCIREHLE